MPAYSFKEQFVPLILDGTKRQTIRGRRKNPPKPGQTAYLYYGMRTKNCRKLGEYPIQHVDTIRIDESGIILYDRVLDHTEVTVALEWPRHFSLPSYRSLDEEQENDFAENDGFIAEMSGIPFLIMLRFWRENNKLPFVGDVIYW